ncbi:MAG: PEP/pyruvate-binding domain-containing protein [Thermodesulfobacteriota bacterium]
MKLLFWFEEIGKEYNSIVGKKCANLGEMIRMGLPVPPGFAISIDMYRKFLTETGASMELSQYVAQLGDLKDFDITKIDQISHTIQGIIEGKRMPPDLEREISENYERLCQLTGIPNVAVSVRSAGVESRPGMFETYLNIKGIEEILEKIKKVWASAYTSRAIAFRLNKGLPLLGDELGVAVVKMVNACASGIGFTVDPISGDDTKVVLESNWGLGEGVVSGEGSVDRFVIDKNTLEILERIIGEKSRHVVSKGIGAEWEEVPLEKRSIPCLNDSEIKELARLAIEIEKKLECPQDIEWAIDSDFPFPKNIFFLQTRPAKVVAKKLESTSDQIIDLMAKLYRP